jgi:hypothetical protein
VFAISFAVRRNSRVRTDLELLVFFFNLWVMFSGLAVLVVRIDAMS